MNVVRYPLITISLISSKNKKPKRNKKALHSIPITLDVETIISRRARVKLCVGVQCKILVISQLVTAPLIGRARQYTSPSAPTNHRPTRLGDENLDLPSLHMATTPPPRCIKPYFWPSTLEGAAVCLILCFYIMLH